MQYRYVEAKNEGCPCCSFESEDSKHQLHCRDPERYRLLCEDVDELKTFLTATGIDANFITCVCEYIRGRGEILFQNIPSLTDEWIKLAEEQDKIGLDNFMEGKITSESRHIVKRQMIWEDGHYTAEDWTKHMISRVLDMTHGQWLYRNKVVHERMKDGITRIEQ